MSCDDIRKALADFAACEHTPEGARIAMHCLYPSFENVRVFVAKVGDGFTVHDGAGAYNTAWLHGRDDELIGKSLDDAAAKFHLYRSGKAIVARIDTIDWLTSGMLSVANASSLAAHDAVSKIMAAQEEALVDRIGKTLSEAFPPNNLSRNVNIKGISGGMRHFDFILNRESPHPVYINSVLPRRNSIAAKYLSFADTDATREMKVAVHDKELETSDIALLQQVAAVVPLISLGPGTKRYWTGAN
jgi:hypothetical protein